jgi:hypothetical protein
MFELVSLHGIQLLAEKLKLCGEACLTFEQANFGYREVVFI